MDARKIIEELSREYPGKKIIRHPQEIVCEIEPATEHPEKSIAIAVVGNSQPHHHKIATETYEVIRGSILLKKDGQDVRLEEGASATIAPGEIHSATGDEAWIRVISLPGWTPEDHYKS